MNTELKIEKTVAAVSNLSNNLAYGDLQAQSSRFDEKLHLAELWKGLAGRNRSFAITSSNSWGDTLGELLFCSGNLDIKAR